MRDDLGFIASLRTRYGSLVEITLQPGTRTLTSQDLDLIRSMLTDLAPGLDKGRFFEKMGQLLGDSVVTAPGQELDVREAMVKPSLGMLAKTVLGGNLDEAAFRRLRADLSVAMNGVGARVMLPDWVKRLPSPSIAGSPLPGTPYGPRSNRP